MSLTLELLVRFLLLLGDLRRGENIHDDDEVALLDNLVHLRRVHDPRWQLRLLSDPVELWLGNFVRKVYDN